ncbi:MAG: hypothetical protein AAF657_09480 [Acidobacteriota bacterium]
MARFPAEIAVGTGKPGHYTRVDGHFALHGEPATAVAAEPLERLDAEGISLWHSSGDLDADSLAPAAVSAVYSTAAGSPLAVPTGQIFVQLDKGLSAGDHAATFVGAGYEVAQLIVYAPHAAWLRAASGDAVDALRQVASLEALDPVSSIEPQMLMARALR